jgi:hypothetical protein
MVENSEPTTVISARDHFRIKFHATPGQMIGLMFGAAAATSITFLVVYFLYVWMRGYARHRWGGP